MKYIKIYEKYNKYLFKIGDYVKWLKHDADPSFYKIHYRRKKAQGLLDDTNVYNIICDYPKKFDGIIEVHERFLRNLTTEEQEKIDAFLISNKYNL
jgi:hypothetical protein